MNEIKCPNCGEVFQVDESGYAAILKQVKDKEFEKEIKIQIQLELSRASQKHSEELAKKEREITDLKNKIDSNKKDAQLDLTNAINASNTDHQKELAERTGIAQSDISKLENGNSNPTLGMLKRLADGMGMTVKLQFVPKAQR